MSAGRVHLLPRKISPDKGNSATGVRTSLSRSGAESEGAHLQNAVLPVHGIFRAIVQWQSTSCGSRSLNSAASKPRRNTTAVEEKSTRVEAPRGLAKPTRRTIPNLPPNAVGNNENEDHLVRVWANLSKTISPRTKAPLTKAKTGTHVYGWPSVRAHGQRKQSIPLVAQ